MEWREGERGTGAGEQAKASPWLMMDDSGNIKRSRRRSKKCDCNDQGH